jgi:hypothetical protein
MFKVIVLSDIFFNFAGIRSGVVPIKSVFIIKRNNPHTIWKVKNLQTHRCQSRLF